MKIKTKKSYPFTSARMVTIKKTGNKKFWQECRRKGTLPTVVGNTNWHSLYGKQCGGSSKIKISSTMIFPPLSIHLKKMKSLSQKDICTPHLLQFIYNSWDMETTQVSFDRWMDKENMIKKRNIFIDLQQHEWILRAQY